MNPKIGLSALEYNKVNSALAFYYQLGGFITQNVKNTLLFHAMERRATNIGLT